MSEDPSFEGKDSGKTNPCPAEEIGETRDETPDETPGETPDETPGKRKREIKTRVIKHEDGKVNNKDKKLHLFTFEQITKMSGLELSSKKSPDPKKDE